LTGFRKFDNRRGNHFVAEVGWAVNSRTGGFESYADETDGLRIEGLTSALISGPACVAPHEPRQRTWVDNRWLQWLCIAASLPGRNAQERLQNRHATRAIRGMCVRTASAVIAISPPGGRRALPLERHRHAQSYPPAHVAKSCS